MLESAVRTCPNCTAVVRVVTLALPVEFAGGDDANILKRCPRCRVWSWMALQQQEA